MKGERNLFRAVRGPVTLITVGALFALQNFTPYGFDQTWPVLLIVFGLLSLLGRSIGPQPQPPPPAPPPQYAWQPPQWQSQPWQPPPPAGQAAPGGYRATTYAQGPADAAPSDPAKGGFGSSAPPKPDASSENPTPGGAA